MAVRRGNQGWPSGGVALYKFTFCTLFKTILLLNLNFEVQFLFSFCSYL